MTNLETLEERIENYVHVNELQHQGIMDKLDTIHNDVIKDLSFHTKRIEKIEKETEDLNRWKIYTIALITIIGFVIPYALSKLFS